MRILVVDSTTAGQLQLVGLIDRLSPPDREYLDIRLSLADHRSLSQRLLEIDVLAIGPGYSRDLHELCPAVRAINPSLQILAFLPDSDYSGKIFRDAHVAGVRKVLPLDASPLDILQELIGIHESLRTLGKIRDGRLTVVMPTRGGLGTTTLCAALAEASAECGKKTLVWDFDIESRDLSIALGTRADGPASASNGGLTGLSSFTRESLEEAVISLSNNAALLPPPQNLLSAIGLLDRRDGVAIVERVLALSRIAYDNIIVDSAGRYSPGSLALLKAAERIIVIVDESRLGLAAAPAFLNSLVSCVASPTRVRFVVCHGKAKEVSAAFDPTRIFPADAWDMPPLPIDSAGSKWPKTGKTLYSLGRKKTKRSLMKMLSLAGLMDGEALGAGVPSASGMRSMSWTRRLLTRVKVAREYIPEVAELSKETMLPVTDTALAVADASMSGTEVRPGEVLVN